LDAELQSAKRPFLKGGASNVCAPSGQTLFLRLWERNLELEIIPVLRELGIGLAPFRPPDSVFSTGKVKRAEDDPEGIFGG